MVPFENKQKKNQLRLLYKYKYIKNITHFEYIVWKKPVI